MDLLNANANTGGSPYTGDHNFKVSFSENEFLGYFCGCCVEVCVSESMLLNRYGASVEVITLKTYLDAISPSLVYAEVVDPIRRNGIIGFKIRHENKMDCNWSKIKPRH